jgi:hypothetical protein
VQTLSSIGIGASISGVADRVFSTAKELGSAGLRAFQKIWPVLSDPKKGVPIAVVGIKLIEQFAPDPNIVDPLMEFGEWMERYDPSKILGLPPPQFNIPWDTINSMLPDEQCVGGLDYPLCLTRNALRALARGIIGGFAGVGSFLYWALWKLAYYAVKALLSLGAYIIKYLIVPIAKAIISAVNTVFTLIKRALCVYVQYVAPFIAIYRAVEDLASGRKFRTAIDIAASIILPMAVVSQDCGFASPLPVHAPPVGTPIQPPVYTPPPGVTYAYSYYLMYDKAEAILRNRTLEVLDILEVKEGTIGA